MENVDSWIALGALLGFLVFFFIVALWLVGPFDKSDPGL